MNTESILKALTASRDQLHQAAALTIQQLQAELSYRDATIANQAATIRRMATEVEPVRCERMMPEVGHG